MIRRWTKTSRNWISGSAQGLGASLALCAVVMVALLGCSEGLATDEESEFPSVVEIPEIRPRLPPPVPSGPLAAEARRAPGATGVRALGEGVGVWTLADLGYRPFTLKVGNAETDRAGVRFRLAQGASQGPDVWFLVRLRAEIYVRGGRPGAAAWLSVAVNGYTSALAEIIRAPGPARRLTVRTTSIVDGRRDRSVEGNRAALTYRNYVQRRGISGGLSELRFGLEKGSGMGQVRVRILPGSGIQAIPWSPAEPTLAVSLPRRRVTVGQPFGIDVHIRNNGEFPLSEVVTEFRAEPGVFDVEGGRRQEVSVVEGRASRKIIVTPQQPGVSDVRVVLGTAQGGASRIVRLPVWPSTADEGSGDPGGAIRWVLGLGLIGGAGLVAWLIRAQRV